MDTIILKFEDKNLEGLNAFILIFIQQYKLYRFVTVQILQGFIEVLCEFLVYLKERGRSREHGDMNKTILW